MSRLPGFTGPSNQSFSKNTDVERTLNYVVELRDAGAPKVEGTMPGRPGLRPFVAVGYQPIRCEFAQDGRMFAISGGSFVEVLATQTIVSRGLVATDGNPATICSNGGSDGSGGHQLFITSGGVGYIFDLVANTLTEITSDGFPTPVLMGGFLDGYFIALKSNSNQFNWSNLEDGLTWDALDVAQISQWPGQILSLVINHNEIWPFSASRTNPWYDSGASSTFQPIAGADLQVGIFAPWSAASLDNTIYWIGQSDAGGAVVYRANGYNPAKISTFAIDGILQRTANVQQAIGWTCQMNGHSFYVLYLQEHETSLVYDASNSQWTEWAGWDTNLVSWIPFAGRCHAFAFGKHLVGDRRTGLIYEMSFAFYSDEVAV